MSRALIIMSTGCGTNCLERFDTSFQLYSLHVFPHLVHLKNLTSLSSAERSCRSHQYAVSLPQSSHLALVVGSPISRWSSTVTSRSCLSVFEMKLPLISFSNPHFLHLKTFLAGIIILLHFGQNSIYITHGVLYDLIMVKCQFGYFVKTKKPCILSI